MTGRHRTPTTPGHRALLGTVPLLGGAGVAAGLLAGAAPGDVPAPAPAAATLPVAEAEIEPAAGPPGTASAPVTETGTAGPGALPGRGELLMDAVAGARDATQARQSMDAQAAAEVSTVAEQLRAQAEERAAQARAAGDAEFAAYHEAQAEQQRSTGSSRPVVPAPLDADRTGDPVADPGATCTSSDLLRLGPVALAGPDDPDCELDPWVAGQVEDSLDRMR
ncbi:hypothetical protein [Pseudonocardia sp. NPDC046786]|uniref:hypothetical protein n=1 Tax=Pseudonocardia sp. NPDC046786 TaxID=3155471 RepID=UPI0033F9635E